MSFRRGLFSVCRSLILVILGAAACQLPASDCADCHDQGQKLKASAHASVACAHCHLNHDVYPHPEGVPKPACSRCHADQVGEHAQSVHGLALKRGNAAAPDCAVCHGSAHELASARTEAFRKKVPETCGMCHTEISQQFLSSVHGKALEQGVAQAPVCTDCHGEHSIQAPANSASLVHPSNVPETCARCHGNVRLNRKFGMPADRVVSFDASYHGLASAAGSQTVANCASCHGVHNILASSDPQSTINPKNLPRTCGQCHPGAGTRFALGPVHLWAGRAEPVSVRLVQAVLPGADSAGDRAHAAAQPRRLGAEVPQIAVERQTGTGAIAPNRPSAPSRAALRTGFARSVAGIVRGAGLDRIPAQVSRTVVGQADVELGSDGGPCEALSTGRRPWCSS